MQAVEWSHITDLYWETISFTFTFNTNNHSLKESLADFHFSWNPTNIKTFDTQSQYHLSRERALNRETTCVCISSIYCSQYAVVVWADRFSSHIIWHHYSWICTRIPCGEYVINQLIMSIIIMIMCWSRPLLLTWKEVNSINYWLIKWFLLVCWEGRRLFFCVACFPCGITIMNI